MSPRFSSVVLLFALSAISLAGGNGLPARPSFGQIKKEVWGKADHKTVYLYTLTNPAGMVVKITIYGGIITSVQVPDKHGIIEDMVLGFDRLAQYLEPDPCFGATITALNNTPLNEKKPLDGVNLIPPAFLGLIHLSYWKSGPRENEIYEVKYYPKDRIDSDQLGMLLV